MSKSNKEMSKKAWLGLALAILVLVVNFLLQQFSDTSLPDEMVNNAETVVATSVSGLLDGNEDEQKTAIPQSTLISPTNTAKPGSPTNTPKPATTNDSADGIWEGIDASGFDFYVLALSWEPAFCEDKPYKDECVSQTEDRFDATNFVLHGLWPDDGDRDYNDTAFCGVSSSVVEQDKDYDWCAMPDLDLSESTLADLFIYMPGTESCLEYHEWYKHGTCSELSAEQYFALSNRLVALFSTTQFNAYVADRIGTEVTRNELLDQFETEFGAGSDTYLALRCNDVGGRTLLSELYITLDQDIEADESFAELLPEDKWNANGNCPREFWIDEVGID